MKRGGRIFATVWLMGALSIPAFPQIRRVVYPLTPPQGGNYNPYLGQQQHNATTYPTPTPWRVNGSPVPATASPQSFLVVGPGGSPSWAPTPSPAATGYNGATPYPTPTSFAVNGSPVPATASLGSYLVSGPGGSPVWTATPSAAATGYNGATPYPTPTVAPNLSRAFSVTTGATALSSLVGLSSDFFAVQKASSALTLQNVVCSAAALSTCTTNPTLTIYDCGASTTCVSPTKLADCTVTAANTIVTASLSSTAVASGDFLVWQLTAGACASLTALGATATF